MAPKLTIITPVYNAEGLLGRALASLQSQTLGFENLRWVLVDDQSTDGSFSLIPVSYTHLDVYKRQDVFRLLDHIHTSLP